MIDMDKIEKIRQEFKELYARIDECIDTLIKARLNKDTNGEGKSLFQMEGLMVGTQQLLCWTLDTLLEEPDKSLEEEISRTYHNGSVADTSDLDHNSYENIARHFAQWGAEHAKKEETPANADLEEAAWDCVLDSVDVNNPVLLPKYKELLQYLFIAGAEWQKEQMMKEAVEGTIICYNDETYSVVSCCFDNKEHHHRSGDKVRIIVCKKEDEK